MKVYTKTGDKKTTGLIGSRTSKSSLRLNCYGTTDEALAYIGLAYYYVEDPNLIKQLDNVMKLFFLIGQDLANATLSIPYAINNDDVVCIESYIDEIDALNDPITTFVLPSGHPSSCYANISRTIIRRAERSIVELSNNEDINEFILPLINRLSDYLYVLSRYLNKLHNYKEIPMIFDRK